MIEKTTAFLRAFFAVFFSYFPARHDRIRILSVVIISFVLFSVVMLAGKETLESLKAELSDKRQLLAWMKNTAPAIEKIHEGRKAQENSGLPLGSLAEISHSLHTAKLDNYVEKSEQLRDKKIRLTFQKIPFNDLIGWLALRRRLENFDVTFFTAEKTDATGIVNAELQLSFPGQAQK